MLPAYQWPSHLKGKKIYSNCYRQGVTNSLLSFLTKEKRQVLERSESVLKLTISCSHRQVKNNF